MFNHSLSDIAAGQHPEFACRHHPISHQSSINSIYIIYDNTHIILYYIIYYIIYYILYTRCHVYCINYT